VRRLREPVEDLKRIGQTGRDRLRRKGGEQAIVVAAAPAETLSGRAECHAGDTDERTLEVGVRSNLCPRGFEDAESARLQLRRMVDANQAQETGARDDAREKDSAPGGERVGENEVGGDFVSGGSVEDDGGRGGVGWRIDKLALNENRASRGAARWKFGAALREDSPQNLFFVRHAVSQWRVQEI
jgi:hypothetical protein